MPDVTPDALGGCSAVDLFSLFGRSSKRFWTNDASQQALARQLQNGRLMLDRLAELNIGTEDDLKMEFFFRTDTRRKALALCGDLEEVGCRVEQERSATGDGLIFVTGWTPPMSMTYTVLEMWTERMCRLGYQHDCRFDGWGSTLG